MMDWHAKRERAHKEIEEHFDEAYPSFLKPFYAELNELYCLRNEAEMLFHARTARTDQRGTT